MAFVQQDDNLLYPGNALIPAYYGELVFEKVSWGQIGTTSRLQKTSSPIAHHACTDAELGLATDQATVTYPLQESYVAEVHTNKSLFKCADEPTSLAL